MDPHRVRALIALFALPAALAISACAATASRDVLIPVATRPPPPAELRAPVDFTRLPVFVSPADPKATSGLTEQGERDLRRLLLDLLTRVRAWEAWGGDDGR